MIKGWKRMIRPLRLRAIQTATGAHETEARFIDAIETGRIESDVRAVGRDGQPVSLVRRSIGELDERL